MEENFSKLILDNWNLTKQKTEQYSPLVLAYLGDDVYDLVVRSILVERTNEPVSVLHRKSAALVKASAQTEFFHRIENMLTKEEMSVYRRGRNAKSHTMAKNASVADYRCATGVEALVGFLFLEGRTGRLLEIMKAGLMISVEDEENGD